MEAPPICPNVPDPVPERSNPVGDLLRLCRKDAGLRQVDLPRPWKYLERALCLPPPSGGPVNLSDPAAVISRLRISFDRVGLRMADVMSVQMRTMEPAAARERAKDRREASERLIAWAYECGLDCRDMNCEVPEDRRWRFGEVTASGTSTGEDQSKVHWFDGMLWCHCGLRVDVSDST